MSERIKFKEYMMDQIQHRYAAEGKISDDNIFVHKLFDSEFLDENDDLVLLNENNKILKGEFRNYNESLPLYILTKTFWEIMNKKMPESLKNIKLVKTSKVKKLVKKINTKKIKICSVGYGGASSNVLYNLSLVSDAHKIPLFTEVSIYEPDNWSLSNILRVGKPILHKAFSKFQNLSGNNVVRKVMTIDLEEQLVKDCIITKAKYLDKEEAKKLKDEGYIFIGAPDFKTREMLYEIGATFIMIGHSNNSVRITKNPILSNGLVQETYGSIDIGILLMNFWFATFHLLDILANQEVNKIEDGTELFSINCDVEFTDKEFNKFKKNLKNELENINMEK